MSKDFLKALFVCSILLTSLSVSAGELQTLRYNKISENKVEIELGTSGGIDKPKEFTTSDPARIVLDFMDVQNKLPNRQLIINQGAVSRVITAQAGNRTRMVVDLTHMASYQFRRRGNKLFVTISGMPNSSSERPNINEPLQHTNKASIPTQTVSQQQQIHDDVVQNRVSSLDFRRDQVGAGRFIIKLDGNDTKMNVRQVRGKLIVSLKGVLLPQRLRNRLDVLDFATPVTYIDAKANPNGATFILSTQGQYTKLAYQSGNTVVVAVKRKTQKINTALKSANQKIYKGKKISLDFQSIKVRSVLQLLADFTGLNLVTSDTVKGNVTLRLRDVPWDQAFDIILKTKGLAKRQNGNVILVAPASEIEAREKQELQSEKQLVALAPLEMQIIPIKYAKATDLAAILTGKGQLSSSNAGSTNNSQNQFLSSRGSVTIDERTNSLLIRDTQDNLKQIKQVIDDLDKPVRQVLIESRIVIANDTFEKDLGVKFGISHSSSGDGVATATSGTLNNISNNGGQLSTNNTPGSGLNVDLGLAKAAGTIGLALTKLGSDTLLQLELSAMQQEGKGEVVSSPRVITSDQQVAVIKQGTEIPYQESSSSGATSVSFKEATLKLSVTPQITPDNRIIMKLAVNKDSVGQVFNGVPSIDTRSVDTQVLVDNGETVVLGGIYEQTTSTAVTRVPFLGEIPYLGALFRSTSNKNNKTELLIFVTPKILT